MLTKSLKWFFAKNEGGREVGFNDAGVETFKGNINRYLAREILQNCLDARSDPKKPVRVSFELCELNPSDIPDLKKLKSAFEHCAEYFSHQKAAKAFFTRAASLASARKIVALKASDYNTTGVAGTDDDNGSAWYSLIRCEGSSTKGDDQGGSFGLGKNAPFAASQIRTVLYSTYNGDSEHIFQGVAMLTSHRSNGASGTRLQPTGYLGLDRGESVRRKKLIPAQFVRSKTGTDVYVLGFPKTESWQKDLMFAVLEHFWPAIDFGDLTVTVGDEDVTQKNLGGLLEKFSVEEDFTAHHYYKAYKNASYTTSEELPILKEVHLHLSVGDEELPKRIAMIRRPGMVVFQKPFRSSFVPFCGVFLCRNEVGNRILREMEPPRHDAWDHDRPEKGNNKRTEAEYIRFIRDCIRSLNATDETKVLAVPGLSRFLPDDEDSPEESFDGDDEHGQESPDRSPLKPTIESRRIDPRRTPRALDPDAPGDEEIEGDGGRGGGGGDGGGGGNGGGTGGTTKTGGEQQKPVIPIRYRVYATGAGVYAVTVQSEGKNSQSATLTLWAVGDQGKNPPEIASAALRDGKPVPVHGGQLGPLALPNQKSMLHLTVKLKQPVRLAMEVAAHATE